jgi:hypothetical protein
MKRKIVLLILLSSMSVNLSCRMLEDLAGNEKAGTVENLWEDVPYLEDSTKTDLTLPLVSRLIIRTLGQGKLNVIAYDTDRSVREVREFYSPEQMSAAGWLNQENSCVGDFEDVENEEGAFCLYLRESESKKEGLAIFVARNRELGRTNIFYARIDMTEEKPYEASGGITVKNETYGKFVNQKDGQTGEKK